jgi:hypothetical protein
LTASQYHYWVFWSLPDDRTQDNRFHIIICPKFWADYCVLIYTTIGSWGGLWAAHWCQWSQLWQLVTAIHEEGHICVFSLTGLWPYSILLCLFGFGKNWHNSYLESVIVEFPMQSQRYICCLWTQIMRCIWCSTNEGLPESLICIFWIPSLSDSQSWVSQNWVCDKSFFKPSSFWIMQRFLYALDLLHNVWHWLTAFQTLSCSYSDLLVLLIQNHEFVLLELHFSAFQFGGLLVLTVLHKDGTPAFFLKHPYFNM